MQVVPHTIILAPKRLVTLVPVFVTQISRKSGQSDLEKNSLKLSNEWGTTEEHSGRLEGYT